MLAWYRVPMLLVPFGTFLAREPAIMGQFGAEIAADGGSYSGTEIDGEAVLVKVRASNALHNDLALAYQAVDPATTWTPTRRKPTPISGDTITTEGPAVPCTPWEWKDREVLSDEALDGYKRKRDDLITEAARKGHVRFAPVDQFDKALLLQLCSDAGYGLDRISTGTFPTTGLISAFGGTEDPLSEGGTWGALGTAYGGAMQAVAGGVRTTGAGDDSSYYNVSTYGPDAECYALIASMAGVEGAGVLCRVVSPGGSGTVDGYLGFAVGGNGLVYRIDNGAATSLSSAAWSHATGDSIGHEVISTTLTTYKKVSGTWSSVTSTTDATYSAAGYVALWLQNNATNRLDDFSGGTVVVAGGGIAPRSAYYHMMGMR